MNQGHSMSHVLREFMEQMTKGTAEITSEEFWEKMGERRQYLYEIDDEIRDKTKELRLKQFKFNKANYILPTEIFARAKHSLLESELERLKPQIKELKDKRKEIALTLGGSPMVIESEGDKLAKQADDLLNEVCASQDRLHKPQLEPSNDDGFENVAVKVQESLTSAEKFLADMG